MKSWLLFLPACLALIDREPTAPAASGPRDEPTPAFLNVRLNHFDASNTETFPMKYYYNNLGNGSDIVIFVGGEWAISPGWVTSGLAFELASSLEGGMFYTEHRYYGDTRPTGTTAVEELRHLNADQALADLAQFIGHVKSDDFQDGKYKNGTVTLVGCSYAGTLATWMRLAYPHLVDAAFSDSGPLLAQEDFPEYLKVITEAIRSQGSEECVVSIREGMEQLNVLLETTDGQMAVDNMFNPCSTMVSSSPLDQATFHWFGVTESFAYLVQYAQPGDIAEACSILTNNATGSSVQRLANFVVSQDWSQRSCVRSRYSDVVAEHTNTSYDAADATMRLWTYQSCVEFGWFQTTSDEDQPFLSSVPLEYFHQMCRDFFSSYFTNETLRSGVYRTNTFFAGLTHLPDYVVTVQGGIDPWSPMGPNENHSRLLAPVYVVPEASHCMAIGSASSSPIAEVEQTKQKVLNDLHMFLRGIGDQLPGSAPQLVEGITLITAIQLLVMYLR